jgi:hypothetical protein
LLGCHVFLWHQRTQSCLVQRQASANKTVLKPRRCTRNHSVSIRHQRFRAPAKDDVTNTMFMEGVVVNGPIVILQIQRLRHHQILLLHLQLLIPVHQEIMMNINKPTSLDHDAKTLGDCPFLRKVAMPHAICYRMLMARSLPFPLLIFSCGPAPTVMVVDVDGTITRSNIRGVVDYHSHWKGIRTVTRRCEFLSSSSSLQLWRVMSTENNGSDDDV